MAKRIFIKMKLSRCLGLILPALLLSTISLPSYGQSLTLEECISIALENNPSIGSSEYNVRESEARVSEVRSGYFPTINLNSGASRTDPAGGIIRESYNAGVTGRYTIFEGGRTTAAYNAAKSNYEASSYQHESNVLALIFRVKQNYYTVLQSERLIAIAGASLERSQLYLEYANARYEAGLAPKSDVTKAEVEVSNAELSLIRARNRRNTSVGALNVTLGKPAYTDIHIVDNLGEMDVRELEDINALARTALNNRPDYKRFDSQLNVQRSNIQIARSEYLPFVSLDMSYNYSGAEISGLRDSWYLGLSLNIPLFNGFSTSSRVTQAKASMQSLELQRESFQDQISLEVWNAYLYVNESIEMIENTKKSVEHARENLEIAEAEYQEGLNSMIHVIDAETLLVNAEQNYIDSLADYRIAIAELENTIGVE